MSDQECQQNYRAVSIADTVPTYTIRYVNADGDEIGVLDFSGTHLTFIGHAEQSAIIYMQHISDQFQLRLKKEYNRGYKAGRASK